MTQSTIGSSEPDAIGTAEPPPRPAAKEQVTPSSAVAAKNSRNDGKTFQIVSFRLGGEEYGVDIMSVQEIILVGQITQVPEVPPHVLGVINLRGNVIPIVNLRRRFGMPEKASDEETRIVVMNIGGRTVGAVVDGVSEVLRLSHDDMSPPPTTLGGAGKDYVIGLARRNDRLLILLDMARLLGSAEVDQVNTTE
ncbi:MAG: chemotaxis protein CheW [Planctomycetes bacterium]|nr:chemotaxis protein CheW [Planctomycetota bacterium]